MTDLEDLRYGHGEYRERRNIYGCPSLVNFVIPSEQHCEQLEDDDEFMENLKLGTS
jgi:hypothetical protein